MTELHELLMRLMKHMTNVEKYEHSEDYKDGVYSTIYIVEMFIKEKLEAYINAAVKQYEDSQAKA